MSSHVRETVTTRPAKLTNRGDGEERTLDISAHVMQGWTWAQDTRLLLLGGFCCSAEVLKRQ